MFSYPYLLDYFPVRLALMAGFTKRGQIVAVAQKHLINGIYENIPLRGVLMVGLHINLEALCPALFGSALLACIMIAFEAGSPFTGS
jgi:hypothetical protein